MPLAYFRTLAGGSAQDEEKFCKLIQARFGRETSAFPVGRARSGIYLLAKLAQRGERRKVLMSPFTIPDVVTMVRLAGAEPVFYDFAPGSTACDIDDLAALIDKETACVIVTHHHVNEPRLGVISDLCRAQGAYLFDDCAISFGGSIDGAPIGTLTDASVFSFSSFKLLNYFWGGLITTRRPELADGIREVVADWPRLRIRDYIRPGLACLKYDLASSPLVFASLVFPLIRHRLRRRGNADGLEHQRLESERLDETLTARPSLAAFAEWWPKIASVDGWLERRRRIAGIYSSRLGSHMVSAEIPSAQLAGACFVNFPILVPPERRTQIVQRMMLDGFDVGRSLYPNVHRHPKFSTIAGESGNVDHIVASTIYLPTHLGVTEQHAEAIADRLAREIDTLPAAGQLSNGSWRTAA